VLVLAILKIPELGTVSVGESLEWPFYIILPNFCFIAALQDLSYKHQMDEICRQLDELIKPLDLITYCKVLANTNPTNPCCPGELVSSLFALLADFNYYNYYTHLTSLFQDNLGKSVPADATASQNSIICCLFESRLVLPFWYWLTQVFLEKRPLNGYSSSSSTYSYTFCNQSSFMDTAQIR